MKKTNLSLNIMRKNRTNSDLERCLKILFEELNVNCPEINIQRDRNVIISNYLTDREKKSFKYMYPEQAEEWDYKKNSPVRPEMIAPNCNEKFWWICSKCGYKWESVVSNRSKGSGCPICANSVRMKTRIENKVKNGGSLYEVFPNIAREWDFDKNSPLTPKSIPYGYSKKCWWICPKGHSYETSVNSRTNIGSGCPICANKKVLKGYNDLAYKFPDIAKEWNYDKNGLLTPENVVYGSHKKVWWICENGHEWETTIDHRTSRNHGCPICKNKKVIKYGLSR